MVATVSVDNVPRDAQSQTQVSRVRPGRILSSREQTQTRRPRLLVRGPTSLKIPEKIRLSKNWRTKRTRSLKKSIKNKNLHTMNGWDL